MAEEFNTNVPSLARITLRARHEVAGFCDGPEWIDPGLVPGDEWLIIPGKPRAKTEISFGYSEVARKS